MDHDFDVEVIRKDFPALTQKIYGKRLAYLDSAASAQKPASVLDAIASAYQHNYANVHRGLYYLANAATEHYEQARETVRAFIGAPSVDNVIFTRGATEAINMVAYSWAMPQLNIDDEIVVTIMEHHSNLVPWHFLRERQGVKLVFVPVDENGTLHLEDFVKALTKRTRLVAVTHMSNVLGTIPPVKQMIALAHEQNIPVLVDGAQGAVHLPVDVVDLDCDWYTLTGHKLYGPTAIGALYGKNHVLERMRPFQGGGEMIEHVTKETVSYNQFPYCFEAGTPPIVEAIGLAAALQYLENIGREAIFAHEHALALYAYERLLSIDGVHILGSQPSKDQSSKEIRKGGIISFNLANIHAHDVAMFVDRHAVALRAGTHCAQPLLQHFSVSSICRISLALYNNQEDIDQLVDSLIKAKKFFG